VNRTKKWQEHIDCGAIGGCVRQAGACAPFDERVNPCQWGPLAVGPGVVSALFELRPTSAAISLVRRVIAEKIGASSVFFLLSSEYFARLVSSGRVFLSRRTI
jgi:hypothetical protein